MNEEIKIITKWKNNISKYEGFSQTSDAREMHSTESLH